MTPHQGRNVNERTRAFIGVGAVLVGLITVILGSVISHMAEAPEVDEFGQELYSLVPRNWVLVITAQSVALGGVLLMLAGLTFGFIYKRKLTWARAMLGALLFSGLMTILFAVVPNQMLTLFQATLDWTPAKIFITIPPILAMNNEVEISYATLKDMIVAGYATTMVIVIPVVMYQMQERAKKADQPKPTPVSSYGRPLRVDR
jgi:hypothetical protein